MPEPEDPTPSGLRLPDSDPAAPAVEALRALASQREVVASAELAAFLDEPAGQGLGTAPVSPTSPRSALVTVVRLPIRRAGRVAVAVGAALALAAIGGVAVAATGGTPDREPAQVQQDDPSDTTTTTTTSTDTETSSTATDDDQGEDQGGDDQGEDQDGDDQGEDAEETAPAPHTANPVASANHHDGKGSDDEHADVNGGGEVDHHSQHPTKTHPTGGDDADEQGDDQGDDQGEDQGEDQGDGGSSHGGGGKHGG